MSTSATPSKEVVRLKMKSRKRNFKKPKLKLFRANEPFISVFMWGVNHTIKELSNVRNPSMLMPDDFKAFSKIKVDNHIFNKENLPSHFKVKEYCPLVFRRLREIFGINDKDYVNSLCVSQPVRVEDKGRSVARFLHSCDRRYVIKSLTGEDIAEMHGLLPKYHQFIVEHNCKTLLPQYLGMYRLTLNGAEHYMIVMRNVFSPFFKAHAKYDLKGSTVQREASPKEKLKEFPTYKDNDFVKNNVKIYLNEEDRVDFLTKLKADVEFLASHKLMDYSLLVGIHSCDRVDRFADHIYINQEAEAAVLTDGSPIEDESGITDVCSEMKSKINLPSPTCLVTSAHDSQNGEPEKSDCSLVYDDELLDSFYGVRSATTSPRREVYYMGLIDILTHYDTKKKAAHAMKTAKHGYGADFSNKSPRVYADRLLRFMINTTAGDVDIDCKDQIIFDDDFPLEAPNPEPSARQVDRLSGVCAHLAKSTFSFVKLNSPDSSTLSRRCCSLVDMSRSHENLDQSGLKLQSTSSVSLPGAEISSIQPSQYGKRFLDFISEHVVSPETSNKLK